MRARGIGVLGSRHLRLSRTNQTTRSLVAEPVATRKCRYSTGDHKFGNWGASAGRTSDKHANETASELSIRDRRLLGRARLHNIQSLEQLHFEADLGHNGDVGSRLLYQPSRRQDLDLWLFLLDVNRQHHGLEGVKATWRGLIYRGRKVELETNNANARDLIDAFIYAGITEDIPFLKDVVQQCIRRDYFTTDLFVAVIGGLLRYRPEEAPDMVSSLKTYCYQGREDLLQVFRAACESTQPDALKHFQGVLGQMSETNIYHDTIPRLWELNKPAEAFSLHQYLIAKRDRPKAFPVLLPFIGYLAYSGQPLDPFLHGLQAAGIDYQRQPRRIYRREVKRLMQNPDGTIDFNPISVAPEPQSKLQDHTIARVLATTTFSFDFLISAVRTFGAVEFGPLAVRQMILTCSDLPTLEARFERLNELEIDTGSSLYVIIVNRLRSTRNWELLRLIAESDMHHDEFANRDLQRRLLNHYLSQRSQPDLTRTLTILNEGHTDRSAQENTTNLLLRSAAICHDWRLVLEMITSLHRTDHRISSMILKQLIEMLLPRANNLRRGFRSTFRGVPNFDVPSFLIGILQQLLATRTRVSTSHWLRPVISLAHHNRIEEIHTLSRFLVDHYTGPRRNPASDCDLHKLFTPAFQRALIAWDFTVRKWRDSLPETTPRTATTPSPSSQPTPNSTSPFDSPFFPESPTPTTPSHAGNEPWLHGARLLKHLRDKHNLTISLPDLEKQYLLRIKRMATAEGSWKVVSNKRAARLGGYSYQNFVDGWENLWYPQPAENDDSRNIKANKKTDTNGEALRNTASQNAPASTPGRGQLARNMSKFLLELHSGNFAERQLRRSKRRARSRYLTGPPVLRPDAYKQRGESVKNEWTRLVSARKSHVNSTL